MTPDSYPALIGYYEGNIKGLLSVLEIYREYKTVDLKYVEEKLQAILKGGQEYWNQIQSNK